MLQDISSFHETKEKCCHKDTKSVSGMHRARKIVRKKMRAVRIAKRRYAIAFVGKQRKILLAWSKYTRLMRHARHLFDRCSYERLGQLFNRWRARRKHATDVQRVFRAWLCRRALKKERIARNAGRVSYGAAESRQQRL